MNKEEVNTTFWLSIVTSSFFTIFGLFLLFKPDATVTFVSRTIAIILAFVCLFGLYKYLTRENKTKKFDISIIYSLVSLITAIVVFFYPTIVKGFIPITIGILLILNTLLKIGSLKQLKKDKIKDFGVTLLLFIIMIILGIILVLDPLQTALNMFQFLGIILTFYAVLDITMCYLFKNNIN